MLYVRRFANNFILYEHCKYGGDRKPDKRQ